MRHQLLPFPTPAVPGAAEVYPSGEERRGGQKLRVSVVTRLMIQKSPEQTIKLQTRWDGYFKMSALSYQRSLTQQTCYKNLTFEVSDSAQKECLSLKTGPEISSIKE